MLDLTIREICNLAYYLIVKEFTAPTSEDDPTIEEQIELFEEKIGQRKSAEQRAEENLRKMLIAQGIDPDVKPEVSPEFQAKLDAGNQGEMSDSDVMWGPDPTREIRGKKIKAKDF